jgi:phenylacetate-CoA ligase
VASRDLQLILVSLYSYFLESILLPAQSLARGRSYHRIRRFLETSQWWSAEQLRDFQWQELTRLLTIAFCSVPFYQRKYAAAGARLEDIRTWDDFQRLPPLTREEVNQHREELFPRDLTVRRLPHATGGSSGVPVRFYRTWQSYDWRLAATHRAYSWSGCRQGERTLYLWAAPLASQSFASRLRERAHAFLHRRLIVPTWLQNEALWEHTYHKALRFRPRFLVGYVSSLVNFARYLESRQLHLPTLRAVLTAAEPLPASVRGFLSQVFRVPVFETYGSREFMSIGAECDRHQGLHLNVENLVVEIASPDPDGYGDILVTDLHNLGTVFIRYVIGDLGRLASRSCPCRRGLPMLQTVAGRRADEIRLPGGRSVSGLFFVHVLKEIPEILQYQVRQESPDRVVLLLVLARELSASSQSRLRAELGTVLNDTEFEIRVVPSIPLGPSGKLHSVVAFRGPQPDPEPGGIPLE